MFMFRKSVEMPSEADALPGRDNPVGISGTHFVNGEKMTPPYPEGFEQAMFGLGCFWGAERCFWQLDGVFVTAVGYAGGFTKHPTYEEVCSGMTGHNEVVLVVFDPSVISFERLVGVFFESHNPTQGMRQGNDVGTQYRSGIYCYGDQQLAAAKRGKGTYQASLASAGYGAITTEIVSAPTFYFAEEYHQQYLAKNPGGYCGIGGTGVACPVGLSAQG